LVSFYQWKIEYSFELLIDSDEIRNIKVFIISRSTEKFSESELRQ
jgi:hypothetical protein